MFSFTITAFSTSFPPTASRKIFLLLYAFDCVIWGRLENSEVFLDMERLQHLFGTREEGTCVACKFSKLECYAAVKNDGPEN